MTSVPAWIALGANLGDRAATLRAALAALDATPGVRVVRASGLLETAPVGPGPQPGYLNAAAELAVDLDAVTLLELLLSIERRHGRRRDPDVRWGPRTLDLDLLLMGEGGGVLLDRPGLVLPHPRLHERSFVLDPLAEIAPDLVHPVLGRSVRSLRAALPAPAME